MTDKLYCTKLFQLHRSTWKNLSHNCSMIARSTGCLSRCKCKDNRIAATTTTFIFTISFVTYWYLLTLFFFQGDMGPEGEHGVPGSPGPPGIPPMVLLVLFYFFNLHDFICYSNNILKKNASLKPLHLSCVRHSTFYYCFII